MFLDDDVVLDKHYIRVILSIYAQFPSAMGVQGLIKNIENPNYFVSLFNRLFYLGHNEGLRSRVLPSASCTYPSIPEGSSSPVSCEWLSGCNQSYRKEVFLTLQFDENLKRYSYKEDVDLSYRVFKTWPLSLYLAPAARCDHNVSQAGRLPKKERIEMEEVYSLYFFYKNIDQNLDGTFDLTEDAIFEVAENQRYDISEGIRAGLNVCDLNHDQFPDLLVGNYAGGISYFEGTTPPEIHISIENYNFSSIEIYPNPANEKIVIDGCRERAGEICLYSVTGGKLHQHTIVMCLLPFRRSIYRRGFTFFASKIKITEYTPKKSLLHTKASSSYRLILLIFYIFAPSIKK
jgi:hypothetical protein